MITIRDIAKAIVQSDERLSCKIMTKQNQIVVKTTTFPDEVVYLLSPYYQAKLKAGTITEQDVEALLIESERIIRTGQ